MPLGPPPPRKAEPTLDLIDASHWGIFRFILKWIGVYATIVVIVLFAAVIAYSFNGLSAYSAFTRVFTVDFVLFPLVLILVIVCGLVKRFVVKHQRSICEKSVSIGNAGQISDCASPFEKVANSNSFRDRIVVGYLKISSTLRAKKVKVSLSVVAIVLVIQAIVFCLFMAAPSLLCPHEWEDATCTQPSTCLFCSETIGSALGHTSDQWETVKEPTCSEEGQRVAACTRCGERLTQPISKTAHTAGEWVVTKEATESQAGSKTLYCSVCGQAIKTESFTMSAEEIRSNFIAECQSYSYEDLMRNPTAIKGSKVSLRGKVVQVQTSGSTYTLRVEITQGSYGIWDDDIMVSYTKPSGSSNIIQDDIINVYGIASGTVKYTTVLGAERTVPFVEAKYIDIN